MLADAATATVAVNDSVGSSNDFDATVPPDSDIIFTPFDASVNTNSESPLALDAKHGKLDLHS